MAEQRQKGSKGKSDMVKQRPVALVSSEHGNKQQHQEVFYETILLFLQHFWLVCTYLVLKATQEDPEPELELL